MKKLSISLLLVVLLSILGLGQGVDKLFEQYQTESQGDELTPYRQMFKSIALTINQYDDPSSFVKSWHSRNDLTLTIEPKNQFVLPRQLEQQLESGQVLVLESDSGYSLHILLAKHQSVLSLSISRNTEKAENQVLALILTLAFYFGILLMIFVWLYPLMRHLKNLSETAKAFGEGELAARISSSSSSFIADIEHEFNRMAERIQILVNDNKLLGNAVSHDLRTPLARLRFGIDAISETRDPVKQAKYITHLSNDISEMEDLVAILLDYARLEQKVGELDLQKLPLEQLVKSCVEAINTSKVSLTSEFECEQSPLRSNSLVLADHKFCTMLINNLLDNACKFGKTRAIVSVRSTHQHLIITIEDDGPGIAIEKRQELLKPFTRGNSSEPNSGYGMGLAIVHRIATWHDASLVIGHSESLGGALFKISFSRAK